MAKHKSMPLKSMKVSSQKGGVFMTPMASTIVKNVPKRKVL